AMSTRDDYPSGVPCWVETLQPDTRAAATFYERLMGWTLIGSEDPDEEEDDGSYLVARLDGADVAGIGALPGGLAPSWVTHVRVDSADGAAARARASGGTVLDGPIDASPAGRFVVLADPAGAVFCAWEAEIRAGAERINEPGAWSMSALQTTDPARAAAFYQSVFGWLAEPWGPVHLFRLPGYHGGTDEQPVPRDVVAVMAPAQPDSRPAWTVDFWVADLAAAVDCATGLGGRALVPIHDRPPFRRAVLADPAGAAFTLSQLTA
ncbi:MAG: VOC family protein, partial [Ilumatobacteraceae bacterium]